MTADFLNRVGLVLGIVGVVVLFFYGPPQPSLEEGAGIGQEDGTPQPDGRTLAEHNLEVRARRRRHVIGSRIGLGLVLLGFLVQLVATYC